MKKLRAHVAAVAVLGAGLITGGTAYAQGGDMPPSEPSVEAPAPTGSQQSGPSTTASNCKKTFQSGAGLSRFVWCFSNDGDVVKIEHSAGLEHVQHGAFIEGFCVSSNGVKRGETFGDLGSSGLSAPSYPSQTKVSHVAGGVLRVEQAFAQTTGTKTITITMKVTNISGVAQNDVFLTRAVDADIAGNFISNVFVQGARSVAAALPGSARLELMPGTTQFTANSMTYDDAFPDTNAFCYDPAADGNESATGDHSMGVLQQLGTLLPGQSKTAKFLYQVSI